MKSRKDRCRRLFVEALETREMLSAQYWSADGISPLNGVTITSGTTHIEQVTFPGEFHDSATLMPISGGVANTKAYNYPQKDPHYVETALTSESIYVGGFVRGTEMLGGALAQTGVVTAKVDRTNGPPLEVQAQEVRIRKGATGLEISGQGDLNLYVSTSVVSSYRQVYKTADASLTDTTAFNESAMAFFTVKASGKFHLTMTVEAGRDEYDNLRLKDTQTVYTSQSWYFHQSLAQTKLRLESSGPSSVNGLSYEFTGTTWSEVQVGKAPVFTNRNDSDYAAYNLRGIGTTVIDAYAELAHYLGSDADAVYSRANHARGTVTVTTTGNVTGNVTYAITAFDGANPTVSSYGTLAVTANTTKSPSAYRPWYSSPTTDRYDKIFAELDAHEIQFDISDIL